MNTSIQPKCFRFAIKESVHKMFKGALDDFNSIMTLILNLADFLMENGYTNLIKVKYIN